MFAVGVQMDHVFGSKWLVTQLSRLGFSIGPDEVTRYKQTVLATEETTEVLKTYLPGAFTMWIADNVDHNPATIDGKGSLHDMGIISASTCLEGGTPSLNMEPVVRLKLQKVSKVTKNKGVPIVPYVNEDQTGLSKITFKELPKLEPSHVTPSIHYLNILWHSSYFVLKNRRSNWVGFMSERVLGQHPGKAMVSFLPILDLDPNDMTCVYSVLLHMQNQARQLNIPTPIITFDQPLWLKATEIINAKSPQIVTILGGFHLLMSYMGSLGTVMQGSGLSEALQEIYGTNAVKHVISGKAIVRALRGHLLVGSMLTIKLLRYIIPSEEPPDNDFCDRMTESEMKEIENIVCTATYESLTDGHIEESLAICKLNELINEVTNELSSRSRTAKYWCQYLGYIELMKDYIMAEKIGDCYLHLATIRKMCCLFAATGHINYAKSARLYLQNMMELPEKYLWLYEQFSRHGFHTVRRSNKF